MSEVMSFTLMNTLVRVESLGQPRHSLHMSEVMSFTLMNTLERVESLYGTYFWENLEF
jgi:hypothetical protein